MYIKISNDWKDKLKFEFQKEYFSHLITFLKNEYQQQIVFPPESLIFNAFNQCDFKSLKVVILGQDPYHNKDQAHGLSFSVPDGINIPPSLKNIFKEIKCDLGNDIPSTGNLIRWANEGVLLLNSILTVRKGLAGSHREKGWGKFTDSIIELISREKRNIVFILWGKHANERKKLIDSSKHLVIESSHPSPFSAYRGFFGSKPFSRCNDYLKFHKKKVINW